LGLAAQGVREIKVAAEVVLAAQPLAAPAALAERTSEPFMQRVDLLRNLLINLLPVLEMVEM
jgi:hypothetical protein